MNRSTYLMTSVALTATLAHQSNAGSDPVTVFEPGFIQPTVPVGNSSGTIGQTDVTADADLSEVSDSGTKSISSAITFANEICFGGPEEYQVSCLGNQLSEIADSIPKNGDYAESARILKEAGEKLQALAQRNRAIGKPPARLSTKSGSKTIVTAPLVAVKTESLKSVNNQAAAILQETQTLLLRSTSNSDRRKSHYAAIANVVGSSKVLLRSL